MVFLELRRNSRITTGNSGFLLCWPREVQLPFGLRGKAGECSRVTAGQKRPQLALCFLTLHMLLNPRYTYVCIHMWHSLRRVQSHLRHSALSSCPCSCSHPHPPFSLPSCPVLIAIESVSHFIVFPTVSDPMNYSPPGSSDHGIIQTRLLECVAIPFSGGSS